MPIIKSAIKRAKQTIKRRDRNVGIKRDIKTAVKEFMTKPSAKALSAAQSEIDTAVKKNLIKKNTAARRKSNLSKIAKDAGVKLATTKAKPAAKPATKKAPATKSTAQRKPVAKAATKTVAKKAPATKKAVAKKPAAKKPAAK